MRRFARLIGFGILVLQMSAYGQKVEMNGFEDISFGTLKQDYQGEIHVLKSVYGYEELAERTLKKFSNVKYQLIKSEHDGLLEYKVYFTGPENGSGKILLYAGANIYRFNEESEVCAKYKTLDHKLINKYKWKNVLKSYSGKCCGCAISLDTYDPRDSDYDTYALFYQKIFVSASGDKVYLNVYRSKKGFWFVREFYLHETFDVAYKEVYDI